MAYIGKSIESGTFSVLDTSGNTYNGSNTTFSLGSQVGSPAQLLVSHDGVIQKPGTDYSLASGGTQITFSTAPASGASIFIVEISGAVGGPLDSDLNGTELILDADGDTSITADTDDQIDIKIAGADDFTITANKFDALAGSNIHVSGDADADDITGDSAQGRLTLGAGQDLNLYHGGTNSYIVNDTGNLVVNTGASDADIVFSGNDGGSALTALTIDMSAGGELLQGTSAKISSNGAIASFTNHNGSASETALASSDGNEKVRCFNDGKVTVESGGVEVARFNSSGGDDNFFVHCTSTPSGGTKGFAVLGQIIVSSSSSTSEQDVLRIEKPSGRVGSITADNSNAAYNTSSDYRLKENVDYTFDATTRLKQLKPARFNWIIDDTNTLQDGFLAHEVSSIVPEAITGTKDATETKTKVVVSSTGVIMAEGVEQSDWTQGKIDEIYPSNSTWEASKTIGIYQQIDQSKLVPLLVKTVQELEARIATLEG